MGMTATERLRELLDECRVEWSTSENFPECTMWYVGELRYSATEINGTLLLVADNSTPEQAIAATLGNDGVGRTKNGVAERETCRLEGFADVLFSVDYEIEGHDMSSSKDYATLAECSSCGAYVIVPPSYHHVLTCDGDEVYQPYLFCPSCGRKVMDE